MTGLPDNNFPAFLSKAKDLRDTGLTIINPAELDGYLGYDNWEKVMQRDIFCILTGKAVCWKTAAVDPLISLAHLTPIDGIIALPGWEKSKGARWEIGMSTAFRIPVYDERLNRLHLYCEAPDICNLEEIASA